MKSNTSRSEKVWCGRVDAEVALEVAVEAFPRDAAVPRVAEDDCARGAGPVVGLPLVAGAVGFLAGAAFCAGGLAPVLAVAVVEDVCCEVATLDQLSVAPAVEDSAAVVGTVVEVPAGRAGGGGIRRAASA
jgi:hypothetical protein